MKAFSTTVSFLQPIAAHDFTIFLFDIRFYATCAESFCEELYCYDTQSRGSLETGCGPCHPMCHS